MNEIGIMKSLRIGVVSEALDNFEDKKYAPSTPITTASEEMEPAGKER
jgi:hypothetical protein